MAQGLEEMEIALVRLESFYGFEEIASCPYTHNMMVEGSLRQLQDRVVPALEADAAMAHADARVGEWRILEGCSEAAFAGEVGGIVAKYLQPKLEIQNVYAEPIEALSALEKHFAAVAHARKST